MTIIRGIDIKLDSSAKNDNATMPPPPMRLRSQLDGAVGLTTNLCIIFKAMLRGCLRLSSCLFGLFFGAQVSSFDLLGLLALSVAHGQAGSDCTRRMLPFRAPQMLCLGVAER